MSDYLAHQFRDRDVFHDDGGRVYVTFGFIQPENRIISYLKYIPHPKGKWKAGTVSYRRIFDGAISSVLEGITATPSHYLVNDDHFGSEILEVPKENVAKSFSPEDCLQELMTSGPSDIIEERAVTLAKAIHDSLDIPFDHLGVTGSVAWKAHNPEWSDVNLNVYGYDNSWNLHGNYADVVENSPDISLRIGDEWSDTQARLRKRTPSLSQEDLDTLYERRTEFICYGQNVTVMPVLLPYEVPIPHGSERYLTLTDSPIEVLMDIKSCKYGIFQPAIYEGQSDPIHLVDGIEASRLLIYDGSFRAMLRDGDRISVSGTLQEVIPSDNRENTFYQIMVGTKQGRGQEYIRLVE